MRDNLNNISLNFLEIKIKNFLFLLGLKEKYISFDYLTWILIFLIRKNSTDFSTYKQAICWLVEKYGVSSRTIIQGLQKITSMCKNTDIVDFESFKLSTYKTINKIRIIKIGAENFLCENLI